MKLMTSIFKEDPLHKQLKRLNLFTDSLTTPVLGSVLELFKQKVNDNQQEQFLKVIIKQLEEKNSYPRKLKIMSSLIEIAKISKYDICDIVLNKKIKTFTRPSKHKFNSIQPKPQKLDQFILEELLIPQYNYLMKLATNQELYHTCKQGEIPYDDIFRRGTKIRFIWIFKLYNIINVLVQIMNSLIKAHQFNPGLSFLADSAMYLGNDMIMMNNFVVKALEQASTDNFMLMPYFDMLQFYQSLNEQMEVGRNVRQAYMIASKFTKGLIEPMRLSLKAEEIQQIEIQALRVKLISNSLKNPKKDHKRLQTEYNEKVEQKRRKTLTTEPNLFHSDKLSFQDKYKNLD